jgi:hypothetical protein
MTKDRHGSILRSTSLAGLLLAAAVVASDAWEPFAEPVLSDRGSVESKAAGPSESAAAAPGVEPAVVAAGRAVDRVAARPPRPVSTLPARGTADAPARLPPPIERQDATPDHSAPSADRSPPDNFSPVAPEAPSAAAAMPPAPAVILAGFFAPDEPADAVGDQVESRTDAPAPHGPAATAVAPLPGGAGAALGSAPLPDRAWSDPDSVNWVPAHATPAEQAALRGPLSRLRILLESRPRPLRLALAAADTESAPPERPIDPHPRGLAPGEASWPVPEGLIEALETLSAAAAGTADEPGAWSSRTADRLEAVLLTEGPRDPGSAGALVSLADAVRDGLSLAELRTDVPASVAVRRTALALARRVAVWRATAALLQSPPETTVAPQDRSLAEYLAVGLLDVLERFERDRSTADAVVIARATADLRALPLPTALAVAREIDEHYRTANIRLTMGQAFLDRLMPEPVAETGPVNEMILGRRVRGTRTVTRATGVRLTPDAESVHLVLEVRGAIDSRTLTSAGPVEVQSRASSTFEVRKALRLSASGFEMDAALAAAENRSRRDSLSTSFDSVPIMRSVVRSIARSQHAESVPEANREVLSRITERARRQVEAEAAPRLETLEAGVRERIWGPMVALGLEPTPLGLETTADAVQLRLRLAGAGQIAAHTPRPNPPSAALFTLQAHDSSVNNAIAGLGIAGRRLSLAQLGELIAARLALPPGEPMADDVFVTFASADPARIQAHDGLVRVALAMDCLESPRRTWHDVVVKVAYRPKVEGMQVFLERDGPVQLAGAGQRGRLELALRAIFSAVFPKERPLAILPDRILENPRMAGLRAVQAEAEDGWLAIAIGEDAGGPADATAAVARGGSWRMRPDQADARATTGGQEASRRRAAILSRVRRF